MRAIDADALEPDADYYEGDYWAVSIVQIHNAPTIEPRCETCEAFNKTRLLIPQPERTGRWIKHIDDLFPAESTIECSECHHEQPLTIDDNYCPYCGAEMLTEGEA